jgi:putative transposase
VLVSSKEMDAWAYRNGVKLLFSRPGTPTDNGYIESFNGKLRDECLNQHLFTVLLAGRIDPPLFQLEG